MVPKEWYKSKTIWLAFAQGVLGITMAVHTQYPEIGGALLLKSALDFILRAITDQPVS